MAGRMGSDVKHMQCKCLGRLWKPPGPLRLIMHANPRFDEPKKIIKKYIIYSSNCK